MSPDEVRDVFQAFGPVSCRRFFGGLGIYADGVMFGLVAYGEIYLKTDPESEGTFREAGSRPFTYDGKSKRVIVAYWTLPGEAFDDPEVAADWARRGLEAARRAGAAKAKTPRRAKPAPKSAPKPASPKGAASKPRGA